MSLDIHRPYAGVALVVTDRGSLLLGAPADAFKATKSYCERHKLPFPRVLVAPPTMLVDAVPQFNPEFFLYDFLFVYGAAFKPDLAHERLQFVLHSRQVDAVKKALRFTLTGPTRDEMASYTNRRGLPAVDADSIDYLARLSENMAIKKDNRPRTVDEMVDAVTFDPQGHARVLDGYVDVSHVGPTSVHVRVGANEAVVDLAIEGDVVPFAVLPPPGKIPTPLTFGLKALGTRSGFDLSGPTTGFVFWINGRAVIYDGPVGTRYLLEHQGISFADVDAIILSHCHEDHMGAFVELILAGHRPKVYTSEPIYRSALVKMASYFQRSEAEVATFVDYQRITPGEPLETLGATFDFFYTVHAIPTIGVKASMRVDKVTHTIQISGDTMHHDGLDKLRQDGALSQAYHDKMRHLIPQKRKDHALYMADVGEAIIHGHPKDWHDNPNNVVYYHCPDNEHTRSFKHPVASPGELHTMVAAPSFHPIISARVMRALKFLELEDPGWFATIMYRGRTSTVNSGDILARHGDVDAGKTFTVIVSGTACVLNEKNETFTTLHPGEFYGMMELVDGKGRQHLTLQAATPMELFHIDASIIHEYVQRNDLTEALQRVWKQRPMVEAVHMFRRLDASTRNEVAKIATEEHYKKGDIIVTEGAGDDDFFLLIEGEVSVAFKGKEINRITAKQHDNFFGEFAAVHPDKERTATVTALAPVTTLRMNGAQVRQMFNGNMAIRYTLEVAIRERKPV